MMFFRFVGDMSKGGSIHIGEGPIPVEFLNEMNDPEDSTNKPRDPFVQADGDELEYIMRNFSNIPYNRNKRVMKWKGEFARFILENW